MSANQLRVRAAGGAAAREAGWIVLATVWALFITWPLAPNLTTRVPQDLGDPLENAWILAWGAHAVHEQPLALFHANMFFPHRFTLAFAENMLGVSIPLAPVFWITHNAILLTNLAALAVTIAGGYGMALLVRRLTTSTAAAAIAAAAFMATPYRVASLSHIHVIAIHPLPFLLLALLALADRPTWRAGGIVAVLVGVQFWSSMTGGIITLVVLGCWGIWTLLTRRTAGLRSIAFAVGGVVLGLALASPVLMAYRHARADNPEYAHPEVEVLENSVTPGAFAYPPPGGPVVRSVYRSLAENFGGGASSEETLFPGFVLAVGGLLGAGVALASTRFRRPALLAVGIASAGALLAFGPRWGGREGSVPLPFALISELVPGGLTRVPARFGALVALSLALLLGLGVARLRRPVALVAAGVLGLLLMVEAWPSGQRFVAVPPITPAHDVLRHRDGVVMALPTLEYDANGALVVPSVFREAVHLYFSTDDFRPRTNGYGAFVPNDYATLAQQVQDFPTASGIAAITAAGVRTVVVERPWTATSRWAGVEDRLKAWPGVRVLADDGTTAVFDVTRAEGADGAAP
jgi:hypothetical protein